MHPPPSHVSEAIAARAAALPASAVRKLTLDVSLVIANLSDGREAVLPHAEVIRAALPEVSVAAIEDLPDLAVALAAVAGGVELYAPPESGLRAKLSRMYALRRQLLAAADTLAHAGVFRPEQVQVIRRRRGPIAAAYSCVALEMLYEEHAAEVVGKVPFGPELIREASALGDELGRTLRPKAFRRRTGDELRGMIDLRDRLWTLLEQSWEDHLWRAGAWLFKRAVDDHVPPLGRRRRRRAAESSD